MDYKWAHILPISYSYHKTYTFLGDNWICFLNMQFWHLLKLVSIINAWYIKYKWLVAKKDYSIWSKCHFGVYEMPSMSHFALDVLLFFLQRDTIKGKIFIRKFNINITDTIQIARLVKIKNNDFHLPMRSGLGFIWKLLISK